MPRRVVLHIGFHKTGTTSVQQLLRANRKLMQREVGMRLRGQMKELVHASRGFSTWRDPLSLTKTGLRFGAVLEDLVPMPKRVLVISCEELAGHMPGRGDLADYSAAPILLERYCAEIKLRFPKAEQVIYFSTRGPDAWLRSAYWEHVKSSSMTMDFDAFLTKYSHAADFDRVIKDTRKLVKVDVHHTALEDSRDLPLGPSDPLLDLCDISSHLRKKIVPQPPENQGKGDAVLLALLEANRAYADRDERKAAKQLILAEARKNDQ